MEMEAEDGSATAPVLLLRAAETGDVTAIAQSITGGARVDGTDEQGRTALMKAVIGGHIDVVELLLNTLRVSLNVRCRMWSTALGYAVSAGHAGVAQRLLAAGADTTNVNERGDTALICAIRHAQWPIIDLLLATATIISVNAVNGDSESALTVGCSQNLPDVVEKLIQAGADVCHADEDGETGLMIATGKGFEHVVTVLLSFAARMAPTDVSAALSYAVYSGHIGIVQKLVAAGANVEHQDRYGFRPLIHAVQSGRIDLVRLLLFEGANVNRTNHHGDTPLMCAADEGRVDVVNMLIGVSANVHYANNVGETALIRASRKGQSELVETLLGLGVAVDSTTRRGWTALLFASQCGSVAVVEKLLTTGRARVNNTNDVRDTALVLAARCGHTRVADTLLAHGALVDQPGANGMTAIHAASVNGHVDVVAALLTAGADAGKMDHRGGLPLLRAIENGHQHVVTMLLASGVDANPTNARGHAALALRRRPDMIECLRASDKVDLGRWRSMLSS